MITKRDSAVAAYAELCVGTQILTNVRANRNASELLDMDLRRELNDAFDVLFRWERALAAAYRKVED